jgi:hypothetical protein
LQLCPLGTTVNSFGGNHAEGQESEIKRKKNIMGDKSPKALNKKSGQKQTAANAAADSKTKAILAKQAAGKQK